MSCKYYKSSFFGDSCSARGKEEKVTYPHTKQYCQSGSGFDKCPTYKEASASGCFITTACVAALGCLDDGHELTVLRAFRDGWLKNQPDGEEMIHEYYQTAPKIVNAINTKPDSDEIYAGIFQEFIRPCVSYLEVGKNEDTLMLYRKMVEALTDKYLEK